MKRKEGGFMISTTVRTDLGHGFTGRAEINYLSSLLFRQAFTESFQEAVFSESSSTAFLAKHWSTYSLNFAATRVENFQTIEPEDKILIRKVPEVSFLSRDRQVSGRVLPVWVSFETAAGLLHRSQPLYSTQPFMNRFDAQPRVMTALRWKDFHLLPSFSIRETYYGQSWDSQRVSNAGVNRFSREAFVELIAPSLTRTFHKKTFFGDEIKHVIEPRFTFRHVAGVQDFDRIIRFDETELLSNTTEAEISLINRFYVKKKGYAYEALTWQLWQRRYFDPTFGDAIVEGQRNVLLSGTQLTPYTFFDRPRSYSPIVSVLRTLPYPNVGVELRTDYDPLLGQVVNSSLTADARLGSYFVSAGHSYVRSTEVLTPKANQLRTAIGWGLPNRKGWNTAFSSVYDFRLGITQFVTTEVAYNSDCCGISMQYRRFSFGTRNENQFRVAFTIANIGSFGTLRKQEKLF
jgi:LPS-assembly protein